jgi:hypothetical protein
MRVIIQQVDLDSCLTALIVGVRPDDEVAVVRHGADERDLADPSTVCIETGGSGRVAERNFDHHEPGGPIEPACRQAFVGTRQADQGLGALVEYVANHDVATPVRNPGARNPDVLSLSSLFSGMRFVVSDPKAQLFAGLEILRVILSEGIDPAVSMPDRADWRAYAEAKREAWKAHDLDRHTAETFLTSGGVRVGFAQSDAIGALGELYAMDCDIAIAYSPRFRPPGGGPDIPKYTIAGRNGRRVDGLLPSLNAFEPGWGGPAHGTIIASPRAGTTAGISAVKDIVHKEARRS